MKGTDQCYQKSNKIVDFKGVKITKSTKKLFNQLREQNSLTSSDLTALCNGLNVAFRVSPARVTYGGREPHSVNQRGSITKKTLGLYTTGLAVINIFKYTAKQNKVRANKATLDTFLHEYVHHLDMVHLKLGATLHTAGFYKRINWLKNELMS